MGLLKRHRPLTIDELNLGTLDKPKADLLSYRIKIRHARVVRTQHVTQRMLRVTFGGEELRGFESRVADEHVKLLFPFEDGSLTPPTEREDGMLEWPKPHPVSRDYTVRRWDADALEVDIDFVVHEGGLASDWAVGARPGDAIWIAGPPRGLIIPDAFTWQGYFGDETALPAIARRLAELPRDMRGVAVIEVQDAADEQPLDAPAGVEVRWLHRGDAAPGTTTLLADEAAGITIPDRNKAFVWAGGETFSIKPLRKWAKEAGLGRGQKDFVGYWRVGVVGDDHDVDPHHH